MEQLIPVLLMLAIAIVGLVLFASNRKKYQAYLVPLSYSIDGGAIEGKFVTRLVGRYQGYDVRVEPHPPSKNTPPYIIVNLFKPSSLTFAVSAEGTISQIFKTLAFVKDIEVGDPGFDKRYVLRAGDEMAGRMFYSNAEVRQAIEHVFDSGYQHLFNRKDKIVARKRTGTFQMENDLRPENVLPVLDAMATLAKYLP